MVQNLLSRPGESDSPLIRCADVNPLPRREPLRHLLIGTPQGVQQTIHRLHNLGYAEASLWSSRLALSDQDLVITPAEGEVLSLLVRYLLL